MNLRLPRIITQTIPANGQIEVAVTGNIFQVLSATSDSFQVGYGDNSQGFGDWQSLIGVKLEQEYNKIHLKDTSGSTNTVQFACGFGEIFQDVRDPASQVLGNILAEIQNLKTEMEAKQHGTEAEPYTVDALSNTKERIAEGLDGFTSAVSLSSATISNFHEVRNLWVATDTDCKVSLFTTSGTIAVFTIKAANGSTPLHPIGDAFRSKDSGEIIMIQANVAANLDITAKGRDAA